MTLWSEQKQVVKNFDLQKSLANEAVCWVDQPCKISVHSDHKWLGYGHFKFWANLRARIWEKLKKGIDVEKTVRFQWKSIGNISGPQETPCQNFFWFCYKQFQVPIWVWFSRMCKNQGELQTFLPFFCQNVKI